MFHFPVIPTIADPVLSPIQEEPEGNQSALTPGGNQGSRDSKLAIEQRNNNTPLESTTDDASIPPSGSNQHDGKVTKTASQATSHIQDTTVSRTYRDNKRVPEPARKPEVGVEVLKQTYLNNYIQDIPSGVLNGPVRFGRLHRSRSQHMTAASQDIRSHMRQLRTKSGVNTNGLSSKMQFRCSRLVADAEKLTGKTLEELLSGDTLPDDYDPELARLFDDYVEACDQITRDDINQDTVMVRRPDETREANVNKQQVDVETKEAFWRGFMEGMSHSRHTHPAESDVLDRAVTMAAESPREATLDPCIDKTNHSDMIRNNQDITHKFLKEWEAIHSNADPNGDVKDIGAPCFACNTEHTLLNDLLCKKLDGAVPSRKDVKMQNCGSKEHVRDLPPIGITTFGNEKDISTEPDAVTESTNGNQDEADSRRCTFIKSHIGETTNESHPNQCDNNELIKQNQGNGTNHIFKATTRVPAATEGTRQDAMNAKMSGPLDKKRISGHQTSKSDKRLGSKAIKRTNVTSAKSTVGPFMTINMDDYTANERNQSRSSNRTTSRNDPGGKDDLGTEPKGLTFRKEKAIDKLNRMKNVFDDAIFKEYAFRDENISIIALAKMKLENKCMSSLALDNALKARSESFKAQIPRCRSEELERDKEGLMIRNIIRNLDLDGWDTKTKPFCEQDNLHMSSSELLHPVDSFESFSSPSPWRQANSTPLITPLDKKLGYPKSIEQTPIGSRTITPDRGTPTSANLSDLGGNGTPRRKYETSAFKPNNHVLKNKVIERVKLRLTKSCDNFVTHDGQYKDAAFANIPLAPCLSYNIEQRMKSRLPLASNINLSETLARQLKQLGKDKGKGKPRTPRERYTVNTEQEDRSDTDDNDVTNVTNCLPVLDGKKIMAQPSSSCQGNSDHKVVFPKIERYNTSPVRNLAHAESQNDEPVSRNQSLPPISCTSLLTPKGKLTPIKASSEIPQIPPARILHCDEESELWMNRSLPCRTESLQTPYTFDKADPSKLLLRTRALPHLHSVCTSCGGINKRHENTSGHERTSSLGGVNKSKVSALHHKCITAGNDEKWRLETHSTEPSHQFPNIGVSKFPNKYVDQSNKSFELTKRLYTNDYSKYERSKKAKNDEMTFRFLDQNIKLRFDVDIKDDEKMNLMESLNGASGGLSPRLVNISKPNRREGLECPITRETRIYREKNRQKHLLQNGETGPKDAAISSPYLEYCKRKAHLQSMKEASDRSNCVDLNKNVRVTEKQAGTKQRKRFPVIQAKTNKDAARKKARTSTKQNIALKAGSTKEDASKSSSRHLFVEPGILPTICQLSPRRDELKTSKKTGLSDPPERECPSTNSKKDILPDINDVRKVSVDLTHKERDNHL